MNKTAYGGFTLVELLVVMAIIAIVGIFTLANYGSFGRDKNLNNAVLDIVSLLRQAQASATSSEICSNGGSWQVEFIDSTTIRLECFLSSASPQKVTKKELQLNTNYPNISISSVSGTSCPTGLPFISTFVPFSGKITFESVGSDGSTSIAPNCTSLSITLTNNKTTKSLIIEQGGRIYAGDSLTIPSPTPDNCTNPVSCSPSNPCCSGYTCDNSGSQPTCASNI